MCRDKAPRLLARAVAQAGGTAALATRLHLNERVLRAYLKGEPIPDRLFFKAIELILQRVAEPPAA